VTPNRETRTVELVQAFLWTCDDCGRDNFERAITVSPESINPDDLPTSSYEDADAIREWLQEGGEGSWVKAPSQVLCKHCGGEFDAAPID